MFTIPVDSVSAACIFVGMATRTDPTEVAMHTVHAPSNYKVLVGFDTDGSPMHTSTCLCGEQTDAQGCKSRFATASRQVSAYEGE